MSQLSQRRRPPAGQVEGEVRSLDSLSRVQTHAAGGWRVTQCGLYRMGGHSDIELSGLHPEHDPQRTNAPDDELVESEGNCKCAEANYHQLG